MVDRVPVLKIDFVVETQTTTENKDKADMFAVVLKTPDKSLKIGLEDAKAALKIKAEDDIVKHNFPLYGEFTCEVYAKTRGVVEPKRQTEPTTLGDSEGR